MSDPITQKVIPLNLAPMQFQLRQLLLGILVTAVLFAGTALYGIWAGAALAILFATASIALTLTIETWKILENQQRGWAVVVTVVSSAGFLFLFFALVTQAILD